MIARNNFWLPQMEVDFEISNDFCSLNSSILSYLLPPSQTCASNYGWLSVFPVGLIRINVSLGLRQFLHWIQFFGCFLLSMHHHCFLSDLAISEMTSPVRDLALVLLSRFKTHYFPVYSYPALSLIASPHFLLRIIHLSFPKGNFLLIGFRCFRI